MKTKLIVFLPAILATTIAIVPPLYADPKEVTSSRLAENSAHSELKAKLSHFSNFQAQYQQTIISLEGKTIMQGTGSVKLKRPEMLSWHQETPDETLLISDGKKTYFYDEFAEQVTILNSQQLIQSTPFALLTNDSDALWQQYKVVLNNGNFVISPINNTQSQVEQLELGFNQDMIKEMRVIDKTGQTSVYLFTEQKINLSIPDVAFEFIIPEGVLVDDQSQGE